MKYGILGCGFACHEGLDLRLKSWFKMAKQYDFVFSFVSGKFIEYEELNINCDNVETIKKLSQYIQDGLIQFLEVPDEPDYEHNIRNLALNHLLKSNCDVIWLLDLSDEYYQEQQIENIIRYINKEDNQFYAWFSIPFKNYIFDDKQWIEGFCPPRIFRVNPIGDLVFKLNHMSWDNDCEYKLGNGNEFWSYKRFASKSIPKFLSNIKHLTWLDNETSHNKVIYQEKHFNGICSYKWKDGHLKFNEDYYRKTGQEIPIIYKNE